MKLFGNILDVILWLWLAVWIGLFVGTSLGPQLGEGYGMLGALVVWPVGIFLGLIGLSTVLSVGVSKQRLNRGRRWMRVLLSLLNMGGVFPFINLGFALLSNIG